MSTNNIKTLDDYRPSKTKENDVKDFYGYDDIHKRFDALEELILLENDVIIRKSKPKNNPTKTVDLKRLVAFLISTSIASASTCMVFVSLYNLISIGWQFFGAIAFASGGISLASFLILLGVDNDVYEE